MEFNKLNIFVLSLVLTGLVIGAGILILDKFAVADTVSTPTVVNDENLTWVANASTITLNHGNITASTFGLSNETDGTPAVSASNYTLNALTGVITVHENESVCVQGSPCYATYTYKDYSTGTAVALIQTRNVIGDISSTWFSLVITIVVLALILTLIIRSFGSGMR